MQLADVRTPEALTLSLTVLHDSDCNTITMRMELRYPSQSFKSTLYVADLTLTGAPLI